MLCTHHAHKTTTLSLSTDKDPGRDSMRDDSLVHMNIWTRPGGRRKSTGIQTDAASSSEVSQDFRPLVQGAGTAQLVGGFVHAVTALPGVTDNPELERVCSRLAISAPHREWEVRVRDLGLDWYYRVFQEPRMTFHGLAFQAGKGTMPRSFRLLDDVRTGESPCCQGGGVSCWASLRSGSCSMSVYCRSGMQDSE